MKVKIRFLTIIVGILSTLLCIGWGKWQVSIPRSLPQELIVAGATASNRLTQGVYYEVSIPPEKSDWYSSADYRLWIPNGVEVLRGLMVMQHGCGNEAETPGLNHANDLQWQALASKYRFAMLGSRISVGDRPCEFWAFPNGGSEAAFLRALRALGQKSVHPELETVPWVLRGHSGGAEWVAYMLQKYPDRTIATVAMRGGGYLLVGSDSPTLRNVPVLFVAGEDDPYNYDCVEVPKQVFLRQRRQGALWAFALAPNTAHEAGNTRYLAIPYLDAVIAARLAEQGNQLRPIEAAKGWLGNLTTHAIFPAEDYTENPLEAVWLPNEEVAGKWREYVTTGKVALTHKPAPPTDVRVTQNSATEAVITWHFTPDLENGLPSFRIYRNNSLIGTLEGQEHNFGDAAEPPNPILEFRDQKAKLNSVYTVAAFNVIGESTSELARLEVNRE